MSKKGETAIEEAGKILGNDKKARRLIVIILILAIVLICGFFSGAIKFSWSKGNPVKKEEIKDLPVPSEPAKSRPEVKAGE